MSAAAIAAFAFDLLVQSTLLIGIGLLAAKCCGTRRPAAQSALLRVTLLAVLLCPAAAWSLGRLGIAETGLLPAWSEWSAAWSVAESPAPAVPTPAVAVSEPTPTVAHPALEERSIGPAPSELAMQETTAPPINVVQQPSSAAPRVAASVPASAPTTRPATKTPTAAAPVMSAGSRWVMPVLAAVWCVGAGLLLLRLAVANIILAIHRRRSRPVGAAADALCRDLSRRLGVRAPALRCSADVDSPCLTGLWKPVILLPDRASRHDAELPNVLLHELAHLVRRDCLFHLLSRVVAAVLFFQPLAWRLVRRIEQVADDVCDDYVVQYGSDRKSYAHTLVDLAELRRPRWTTATAGLGIVSLRSSLSRRILRILDSSRTLSVRLSWTWLAAIVAVGLSTTAGAALLLRTAAETKPTTTPVAATEPPKDSPAPVESKPADEAAPVAAASDAPAGFRFRGRVVDPDGRPVLGAKVSLYQWQLSDEPVLATTNAAGEFDAVIPPDDPRYAQLAEQASMLVVTAEGYGLAAKTSHECETSGALAAAFQQRAAGARALGRAELIAAHLKRMLSGSATFRLVRDDVPLTGRVVDIEGRPVPQAVIRVSKLSAVGEKQGGLDAWEQAATESNADYYWLQRFAGMSLGDDVGGTTLDFIPPVVSDADGRFTLNGIGADRILKLLISGPGIETSRVYARTRAGEAISVVKETRNPALGTYLYHPAEFTHVAGPSQAVVGTVRDSKTGVPLAGVTLQSHRLAGSRLSGWTESIVQTVSDEQGRYRLSGLPIGENEVLVLSSLDQPYLLSRFTVETKPNAGDYQRDMELTRGVWITGRAFDSGTGEPISSGRVEYFARFENPHVKTVKGFNGAYLSTRYRLKRDGTFRVPGLPGPGIVGVMAELDAEKYQRGQGAEAIGDSDEQLRGFRTYPLYLSAFNFHVLAAVDPAVDADAVHIEMPFDSGQTVTVEVVDADGQPVTGGYYTGTMEYSSWRPFSTNRLEIRGYQSDKPRRVQVYHAERKLAGFLKIEGESPENLKIVVAPWAEVSGRLVDANGVPQARATIGNVYEVTQTEIEFAVLPPNLQQKTGSMVGFATDDEGRFRIAGLVAGYGYRLSATEVRDNGIAYYLGNLSVELKLKPGEDQDLGDVPLVRGETE